MRVVPTTVLALLGGWACGEPLPPAPPQPVAFSHKVHAGANQIGCTMCHSYATHSPTAGIPSLARCVGCHKFVDKDKPEIQAMNKAFEDGKPIVWNRVYRVPDHVYFSHERHLSAGVRCQRCHGEVQDMDVLEPVTPLTMGWCLDCHESRVQPAPRDCLVCHK
jgi:hypothetical protein